MADISKGKRSSSRRSSILKRALADIDVNVKEKKEVTLRRASKRVSFAETCCVKEFPRDSPQFLKQAESKDADTPEGSSHPDASPLVGSHHPPSQDVEQPLLDNLAATGSNFVLDDGETTFVSGVALPGGFYESTRNIDRLDSCGFGEADGLDISEITPEESSVFVEETAHQHRGLSAVPSTFVPSADSCLPLVNKLPSVSNPLAKEVRFGPTLPEEGQAGHRFPADRETAPPAPGLGCQANRGQFGGDQTVMFDDQDGGTMDLTLMDTTSRASAPSQPAPKLSAREFLSKLMGSGNPQVLGMHQVREERTVFFANSDGDGITMEFTQNLPQNHITTTTAASLNSSQNVFMSIAAAAPGPEDRTILFGNADAADEMNLTTNLSPMNMSSVEGNKVSAKSFLASLRGEQPSGPTPFVAPQPSALAAFGAVPLPAQPSCDQEEQREDVDTTVTMEMTGCLDTVSRPFVLPLSLSTAITAAFHSVPPQNSQQSASTALHNTDAAETMELTGCVESTQQLLLDANSSAVTATNTPALSEGSISGKSPSRNALVDITSRYSTSPTPPPQAPAPAEEIYRAATQSLSGHIGTASTKATITPVDRGIRVTPTRAASHSVQSSKVTATTAEELENQSTPTRAAMMPKQEGNNRAAMMLMQQERRSSSLTLATASDSRCASTSIQGVSGSQLSKVLSSEDMQNKTIQFTAEETGAEMEMTDVFVVSSDSQLNGSALPSQATKGQTTRVESSHMTVVQHCSLTTLSAQEKSMAFGREGTRNEMSFTCQLPSTVGMPEPDHSHMQAATERSFTQHTKHFEHTAADMSLTCTNSTMKQACSQPDAPEGMKRVNDPSKSGHGTSVAFNAEETAADMSLTCATLTHAVSHGKSQANKSILTGSEETTADMSLTCATLRPTVPVGKSQVNRTILIGSEETAADMSLTCANIPHTVSHGKSQSNKTTLTAAAETGADASLTYSSLPSNQQESEAPANKSIKFNAEETAADMSLTCTSIPSAKSDMRCLTEKSVLFRADDTAANMSLTCINPSQKLPNHVDATLMAGPDHNEKHQLPEKSIVFAAEATAANMSLTCSNLSRHAQVCEEEVITFKSDRMQHQEEEDVVTFKSDQTQRLTAAACTHPKDAQTGTSKSAKEQPAVSSADGTMGQVTPTCPLPSRQVSHDEGDCLDSRKINTRNVSDPAQQHIDAQPLATGTQNTSSPGQRKECLQKVEAHNAFNKEPTTLAELTEVFAQLKKKMEQTTLAAEEEDMKNKAAQVEGAICKEALPPQQQSRPESARAGPSRKLQLSPTTMPALTPCMSREYGAQKEKGVDGTLPRDSLKRHSLSFDMLGSEPAIKNPRLSSQALEYTADKGGSGKDLQKSASSSQERSQVTDPCDMEIDGNVGGSASPPTEVKNSSNLTVRTSPTQQLNHTTSSSSSNATPSPDIFAETMPMFFPSASNSSGAAGASTSVSAMSMSAVHNTTGSSVSLGKSFVDRQSNGEQPSSFLQTCEQLGIEQFELKGRLCRRSSGIVKPDVACDTLADRLNLMSVVQRECEAKADFFHKMGALLQREEASSEELERTVMRRISQLNLVSEAQQSPSVKQQVRRLLTASKKHMQATWKTFKAEMLYTLTENIKVHHQAVLMDMSDMMASTERMVALTENVNHSIDTLQSRLDSIRSQISSRKHSARHHQKQQQLQQRRAELVSLQERVSEAKSAMSRLEQKAADLQAEKHRARQRYEANRERQKQLMQAHNTLSTLQSLHCWRPVRVEEQRVDCLLLYDAVLLSVALGGASSPQQPVTDVSVTSRLKEGSEAWAVLATQLTVDTLSAARQQLVDTFSTREHLQQLLDEATRIVEDIKSLCQEVKLASLRHQITIKGRQVKAEVWNTDRLRKVSLSTDIPVNSYPHNPLTWHAHVIMGDTSESQLQKVIAEVGAGRKHISSVLQAVHTLIQQ